MATWDPLRWTMCWQLLRRPWKHGVELKELAATRPSAPAALGRRSEVFLLSPFSSVGVCACVSSESLASERNVKKPGRKKRSRGGGAAARPEAISRHCIRTHPGQAPPAAGRTQNTPEQQSPSAKGAFEVAPSLPSPCFFPSGPVPWLGARLRRSLHTAQPICYHLGCLKYGCQFHLRRTVPFRPSRARSLAFAVAGSLLRAVRLSPSVSVSPTSSLRSLPSHVPFLPRKSHHENRKQEQNSKEVRARRRRRRAHASMPLLLLLLLPCLLLHYPLLPLLPRLLLLLLLLLLLVILLFLALQLVVGDVRRAFLVVVPDEVLGASAISAMLSSDIRSRRSKCRAR